MSAAPILIFQMQRMGDLVLSFPLLGWLGAHFPGHPLWVVGERMFYEPLMPFSPPATYFDYAEAPDFRAQAFRAVINLSHRPEAAALAGQIRSDILIGPYRDAEGRLFIKGDWQLYRASLTHNNRYNLFHWADLNALDIIPASLMLRTAWPLPRPLPERVPDDQGLGTSPPIPKQGARIGLFLGASEPEKHPDADFWAALTRSLLRAGHKPALLGGPAEQALGAAVAGKLKAPALNLCGRFSVSGLAGFVGELDLLVTPDTGPMHVAVWTGTPVLNLSLGPVNPWVTGPFSPGHHVVRASLDCVGCWRCHRPTGVCKEDMAAAKIAALVEALLAGRDPSSRSVRGLELLRSRRAAHGLYGLETIFRLPPDREEPADEAHSLRQALSLFWQVWFGNLFGRFSDQEEAAAWAALCRSHPDASADVRNAAAALAADLAKAARGTSPGPLETPDFWTRAPQCLRPLSGYLHMYLQNALGGKSAFLHGLSLLERIAEKR